MEMKAASQRILAGLVEARTGQRLALDRRWRIDSALAAVLRERGLAGMDQLVAILVSGRDPALTERVIEALLNNETYFFRDRLPFDLLLGEPLDRLERARAGEKRIAIWCAGCSTGQEAWSLAMSFAAAPDRWRGWRIDIVGTDLSRSAIGRAREAAYSQFEVQRGLPVALMLRWFEEQGGGAWRIVPELRDKVRFETGNLLDGAPAPARFDIVLCRNVLLYFAPDMRRLAFARLAEACRPEGTLMLGAAETVLGQTDRFVSDPRNRGLYVPAAAASAPRLAAAGAA